MARRPVRVLHLRDSPWIDGPGRTILESATHFDPGRIDYHIGVFVSRSSDTHPLIEAARQRGARAHGIVDIGGFDRHVLGQVLQLVKDLDIDVVHTSELRSSLYGWLCRWRLPQIKLVATTHGWIANSWRRRMMRVADKALLRQFDAVVMVSAAMRRLVPAWWLPPHKVEIIHNALPVEVYGGKFADLPRRPIDRDGRVVVLNVGRLSPEKGQELLLRAFAEAARAHPHMELWFAGHGPLEQGLRGLAASLGLGDRVRFLGYVADMPALYHEVDVVVQSSFTEGMPNVILEAAYLRVPIIATAVGGTVEVIDHSVNGWLIPAGSVVELGRALDAFVAEPERFAVMGAKGRERIASQFSFDARTEKVTRLYERLVAKNARP